jgi:YidC/Oxa1 family membrane protein insertase
MEKRLLISITLSFLVLYAWSALIPRPQKPGVPATRPQQFETNTKDGIETSRSRADLGDPFVEPTPPSLLSETTAETYHTLENDYLKIDISSRGAAVINILIKSYNEILPLDQIFGLEGFSSKNFQLSATESRKAVYTFKDNNYKIDKSFQIAPDDYTINISYVITNLAEMSKNINMRITPFILDMSKLDVNNKKISRDRALFEYVFNTDKKAYRKNNAFKFNGKDERIISENIKWAGFRNRYYTAIVKPLFESKSLSVNTLSDQQLKTSLKTEDLVLSSGEQVVLSAFIYAGPEDANKLKNYAMGLEEIKRFYRLTLFDAIAKIIYEILHWLHRIIPNWGVAIILISIIIYGSMYPLTLRSMISMKKMQAVQPKIAALKTKYKDNPQKMNKELMSIYKENKINPLGGCVPILFQMPVFIGLYQVLWRDVSFKGADFLWIKDLSEPDKLFSLPANIPFIGSYFNLLPVLMIGIMFVQTRLQAKNMVITDPSQQAQQKMMSTIMPFFMGFIFYHFASGLTLYFTMFYIFSTASQWYISKKPKEA